MTKLKNIVVFFKMLSDMTRLSIVSVLINKEMSVSSISNELKINQSTVSHQLQLLRISRIVNYRRMGKEMIYSIDDEHIAEIYKIASSHLLEIQYE